MRAPSKTLIRSIALALLVLVGCDDDDAPGEDSATTTEVDATEVDATDDATDDTIEVVPDVEPDVAEVVYGDVVYAEVMLPLAPDHDEAWQDYGDQIVTTLVETLRVAHGQVPHRDEDGALRAPVEALGRLAPQPGEPHRLRDQLAMPAVDWTPGDLPAATTSILYMFVIADPQLVDQDSPAQVAKNAAAVLAGIPLPAYTPQGELGPHLNDALVRTADRFQDARPFDVVVIAGDHIENTQGNELTQLHAVINGGLVSSDSGARDDVRPGPDNDAYDPFIAGGFRAGTPWISSIGNHDVNIQGNFPPGLVHELNTTPGLRAQLDELAGALGVAFPFEPTADAHPALFPHALRSAFRVEVERFHPDMMTSDDELRALAPGPTSADPTRAAMGPCGFIARTFAAAGDPPGHGFSQANVDDCTGFYTYDPVPGVPVRIVSLDLGPHEGGSNGILSPPHVGGVLDAQRAGDPTTDQIAFLEATIAEAEEDGVALIVLSHQASDSLVVQSQLQDLAFLLAGLPDIVALIDRWSPIPPDAMSSSAFRQLLASSPNVVAHVAGHNHRHRVRAICPDGSARADGQPRCDPGPSGETGYWEITTASGLDFPHQGRFVELVHVADRLAALYLTTLDPRIPEGSFSEHARFVSVAREQLDQAGYHGTGELGDRNALLPLQLPPAVAARMSEVGQARVESETTLREPLPALPRLPVWP
ncbi:MAG: hypothetical protein IT385_21200 [Deltaproteobacteria bacterium]|nr:hypothetical protein [Deltaproteobacteria bacterium]